jgi:dimethylhistidine N-methyltransferase
MPAKTIAVDDQHPQLAQMRTDVLAGLTRTPKRLPSQYLYDTRGAQLFDDICYTEEYYPTRTEIGILRTQLGQIADLIGPRPLVIEPGSGSGIKTRLLLAHLHEPAGYVPIDIARAQLKEVGAELNDAFPKLKVHPVCADFTSTAWRVPAFEPEPTRRVVFIPGSTIGNFHPESARRLLERMRDVVGDDGRVLVGVDRKKDAAIIEPAYDDAAGVSAAFAMNYLVRLNDELDADIDLDTFEYTAPYNAAHGRIEMGLVSRIAQTITVGGTPIDFAAGEKVITEYSYKYHPHEFIDLARSAGLTWRRTWTDRGGLFSILLLAA